MYIIDNQDRDLAKRTELLYNELNHFQGTCVLFNLSFEWTIELLEAFPKINFVHQHTMLSDHYENSIVHHKPRQVKQLDKQSFAGSIMRKAMDSLPIEMLRCFRWIEDYARENQINPFQNWLVVSGTDIFRYCYTFSGPNPQDSTSYKIETVIFKPYD